ncbi:hypothetical protein P12x_003290 [Tundrisphaera lichenicola]|uniref:hypothetical protein n=1 Tax=Tundrisphaera lichenicola TaxID=2029860 RepID=UPI003EBAB0FD
MVADYYEMLGADPGADRATLEKALARRQPLWSSGTRNPKTKHTYQSYLDQIPEIRRALLSEPSARAAYDAERAEARRAERDQKLDELQRLVRLRAAKGGLTVTDRSLLRDQAGRLGLTSDDLDRLIEPIPPRPETPSEPEDNEPSPDILDAVTRKQIRSALEHLRRRDLYDALEVTRDAPAAEVTARADAERRRWMQKTQVTAEKTAWLEAVSHAQSHLGSPQARARYDRTLAAEAEERFGESVSFAVKGLPKLDYGTRAALIDDATARGIAPDRADLLITRGCRALGVVRDGAPALILNSIDPPRYLRCRACSGVTDFADVSGPSDRPECRHCRASLQWGCPSCRRVHWVDQPRCGCGFPLEHREPLIRHFEAAQQAHRAREYERALDHLGRVRQYAPNHAGARKGVETIRRMILEADEARIACESARARRHLVAARAAILAWGRLVRPDAPEFLAARDEVARGLRMAQALAARARGLEADDPTEARTLFEKALAIAADLDDAREGLRRSPPAPPSGLTAEVLVDRVRLRWTPPPADGLGPVRFRVIRKRGGCPSQLNDGAMVIETAEAEAEDQGVGAGESAGYAVFAIRGEVASRLGASGGPIDFLPGVAGLRTETRSGEVTLNWTLPEGASGVRVVRNPSRRPIDHRDGQSVEAHPGGLIDRGLTDDRTYHYGIFAVYATRNETGRLSRGVFASAFPCSSSEPIPTPTLTPTPSGRLLISWPPPSRGSVRVIRTARPLSIAAGDRLPSDSLASWEGDWLESTSSDHSEDPSPPPIGVCYYTPVLTWNGEATVGHPARFSRVADPSDLRAVRAGGAGRVHLRWRWSPQGTETRVLARSGSPPTGPDDPEALGSAVSDEEYSRMGYFALTLPTSIPGPWHLAVFSVARVQGEAVVSPGLDPSARTIVPGPNPEVTVSYVLRRPSFPGRSWSVSFRTEPAGSAIPPTALVAHPRTVPLSADDGQTLARFPATRDGETFPIPNVGDLVRQRARIFADPRADPDGLPPIRLRHPEGVATRV